MRATVKKGARIALGVTLFVAVVLYFSRDVLQIRYHRFHSLTIVPQIGDSRS